MTRTTGQPTVSPTERRTTSSIRSAVRISAGFVGAAIATASSSHQRMTAQGTRKVKRTTIFGKKPDGHWRVVGHNTFELMSSDEEGDDDGDVGENAVAGDAEKQDEDDVTMGEGPEGQAEGRAEVSVANEPESKSGDVQMEDSADGTGSTTEEFGMVQLLREGLRRAKQDVKSAEEKLQETTSDLRTAQQQIEDLAAELSDTRGDRDSAIALKETIKEELARFHADVECQTCLQRITRLWMNPCGHITCIECSFEWTASLNGRPPTCLTCRVVLKSAPIRVYAFQFLHDQVTGHGPHGETWVPRITYGRNVSPAVRRRELYGGPMPVVVQGAAGAGANTARRGAGGEGPDAVVEGLRRLAQERVLRELG
ncbi:hypothetical protein AURDEDRAFT_177311, partial [Auricularia subglabra TFB-10046 SS5]